ncbi:hypothetical protein [Streptomyces sp. ODS28]|uniref:hypothetical protein n=1 Tax=Streptomyces sp. ODS28 TaxID=3136688 RepID=UPI0031EF874D
MTRAAAPATGPAAQHPVAGAALPLLPYCLLRSRQERADTVAFHLEPVAEALPPFTPGQFAMAYAFGIGETPVPVSGIAGLGGFHTARGAGAVSRVLCGVRGGDVVGLRGPFGTDWGLNGAAGRVLLALAGGISLRTRTDTGQSALDAQHRSTDATLPAMSAERATRISCSTTHSPTLTVERT